MYISFQWFYNNIPLIMSHSVTTECTEADVDIYIEGPTVEEMFLQRAGTINCHVTVNKGLVEKIYWENQYKNEMVGASMSPVGEKKKYSLSLDITYDEWSQGIKRYCVVDHKDSLEPYRVLYERTTGKTIQQLCNRSLRIISLVMSSDLL